MGIIAGSLGITAGLLLQRTIPAFVVGLGASLLSWILGGAFGLPAGFSGLYEQVSRLMPNTYAVELLFPRYYGAAIGSPVVATLALTLASMGMMALTWLVYRRQVLLQQG